MSDLHVKCDVHGCDVCDAQKNAVSGAMADGDLLGADNDSIGTQIYYLHRIADDICC